MDNNLRNMLDLIRQNKAQTSLEVLLVFTAWFLVIILYLNVIFVFSSLMMAQSAVNRLALQAASTGCLPTELRDSLGQDASRAGFFGAKNIQVYAATNQLRRGNVPKHRPWGSSAGLRSRSNFIGEDGVPIYGTRAMRDIPCRSNLSLEYGHAVYVAVVCDQEMLLFGSHRVVRSATLVTQTRQGVL